MHRGLAHHHSREVAEAFLEKFLALARSIRIGNHSTVQRPK